ncbi:ribonuclease P protein component [[Mycoplasma] mobile]|uniref:Ribonuclease P protein component n=1 Tax=Mycoplasma mobile (strain ATCC 43663 / 163K / NCTC 11711) TaxID=267748 RepID=RNPA_MYCM1|nr:ribonuclease P protein component [[Mycoplasma] mobile]Q6KH14.1 RecName: Full=Ribonuclease P protein component; Short=RNase P protein; Short=RNaseP protein; AltName: Full=Protein C5 [Mycoplasma mobile 163K]AAT28117.1 ribonuclease p protein component [Mycoplasma mobile 163K]
MKRKYILKKNWEFQKIIDSKKQFIFPTIILYYKKSDSFQIGISIPKKFAIAVKRNYLKRQIKSILDQIRPYNLSYEMILIVRKNYLNLNFLQKQQEIKKIIERISNGKEKIK